MRCVGYELMRVHFKPKTKLGKWSAWLIVASAVSVGAASFRGQFLEPGVPFFAIPWGIAAFITGFISILRSKERSLAVYLAVGFGSFILILWIRFMLFILGGGLPEIL